MPEEFPQPIDFDGEDDEAEDWNEDKENKGHNVRGHLRWRARGGLVGLGGCHGCGQHRACEWQVERE